ncbi:cytidylyltransferase domain-containing protein [Halopiger xanaduensis]|uniref:Acylneuraminate cytidylyltransferase n=1 Tax=Halopiger xanaduensis (strain DSM 18323 / JCM 14033 / SH-6) TaxID=797210 RepID=F8DEL1_HALXS|nr:glycosyltransferase family protein [Halopiger xanaduensis]AEH39448.1 acylneuraminate cytidylyltransferase [Halopiger xanaduensis SH-6]
MSEDTTVVACIQARMGSTRLPGKMMLQLRRRPVISHVVSRVSSSRYVDTTVVATSDKTQDDILEYNASQAGADVFRGSEDDVLGRVKGAAETQDADIVVRICADCPLISPAVIDQAVSALLESDADYASNTIDRTFPRGMDVEAFTMGSFEYVDKYASEPHEREHVTPYYYENAEAFDLEQIDSADLFDDEQYINRTDLRLTLDEADDYELFKELFKKYGNYDTPTLRGVIDHVDSDRLADINAEVTQKTVG